MLNIVVPTTLIATPVWPDHFSFSMPLVVLVLPDILCTAVPNEVTLTFASVLRKFPFVRVALRCAVTAPLSIPMLLPLKKFASIDSTTFPSVLALALSFTVHILPSVCVARGGELVRALTVFEAHIPLAFVDVPIAPGVHSVPVGLRLKPFPDVRVLLNPSPDTVPVFQTIEPGAIVDFAVGPSVNAHSRSFSLDKVAIVAVAIWVALESLPVSQVIQPVAFVLAPIAVLHYALSVASIFVSESVVHGICIFLLLKSL